MKRLVCLCLVVMLVLAVSACSAEETTEERIERVMTVYFTCPDEELIALVTENVIYIDGGSPEPDKDALAAAHRAAEDYGENLKTKFTEADFTEEYQTKLCGSAYIGAIFPSFCAQSGISLTVDSVTVALHSESSRTYNYTAELQIEKDGEKTPFTQTGRVQVDEDGRISWIDNKFNELTTEIIRIAG